MSNNSGLAQNVVLEVAEVIGTEVIQGTVQTGTNTIYTFEDCDTPGDNITYRTTRHSLYNGEMYSGVSGVGYLSQGCEQEIVTTGLVHADPGINKCIAIDLSPPGVFIGNGQVHRNYVDENEVYSSSYKNIKFTSSCLSMDVFGINHYDESLEVLDMPSQGMVDVNLKLFFNNTSGSSSTATVRLQRNVGGAGWTTVWAGSEPTTTVMATTPLGSSPFYEEGVNVTGFEVGTIGLGALFTSLSVADGTKLKLQLKIDGGDCTLLDRDSLGISAGGALDNCTVNGSYIDYKSVYTSSFSNSFLPFESSSLDTGINGDLLPGVPDNSSANYENVQGKTLYLTKVGSYLGSTDIEKEVDTLIFDIVDKMDVDTLLVKGNGTDHINTLNTIAPDFMDSLNKYNWYISAFQHSGCWNSRSSTNVLKWVYTSKKTSTILSYEETLLDNINHETYRDKGALGLRLPSFGDGENIDFYQIEVDVTSIVDCEIQIKEGYCSVANVNPLNPEKIKTTGVYTFCLPSLKRTGTWGNNNNGGVDGLNFSTNIVNNFANGSVHLLTAIPNDPNADTASCNLRILSIKKMNASFSTTIEPVYGLGADYTIDKYKWDFLDVLESKSTPLSLNFTLGDFGELGGSSTGYSKTFNIPANQHNNKVLHPMLGVGSNKEHINWVKSRVKVDGVYVFKGLLRIEEGVTGKGGFYKCHIIEDGLNWSQAIGDDNLCDLALGEDPPLLKSRDNIVASWLNTPQMGDDYFYGLVNYGEWYSQSTFNVPGDYNKTVKDFHPTVFSKSIVDKIFLKKGYLIESNFLNSPEFLMKCHPYCSGEEYVDGNLVGAGGSQFVHVERNLTDYYNTNAGETMITYPDIVPGTDVGNNWSTNGVNGGYTAPFTATYESFVTAKLVADGSSDIITEIAVMKNNSLLWFDSVNGGDTNAASGVTCTVSNANLNLDQGDKISVRIKLSNGNSYFSGHHSSTKIKFDIFPKLTGYTIPTHVNLSKILPCTKQIDYLKGITELFNLQWHSDNDKKIVYCEPYDDFLGSGKTVNWTDKLNHSSWSDKYIINETANETIFKYNKDTGDKIIESVYNWREENGKDIYKSHIEYHDRKYVEKEKELGTKIFSSTVEFNNYGTASNPYQNTAGEYRWGDMSFTDPLTNDNNPIMPIMWNQTGGSINGTDRPPYNGGSKFDFRILNYYGEKECSPYTFLGSTNSIVEDKYPYLGWINKWDKGIKADPYSLSWGDEDDGEGIISPGLFSRFWANAYDNLNGNSILRTCYMNLTAVDIAVFDYRDLIHLKIDDVSTYWVVNKIIDYKPNQNVLTKVELIEWRSGKRFNEKRRTTKSKETGLQGVYNEVTLSQNTKEGLVLKNNTKNISTGTGISFGNGVVAADKQTVIGNYNKENKDDVLLIGAGISKNKRVTALSVTKSGEVQIHGGELAIQETDGLIHDLVYTDENGDIKKVYLKKE
jgi:hypothetical protein|tara:strand:+ start:7221 stop:11582 length:4362 start_codon:yes stop_codon:yes gene_type:complete